LGPRQIFSYGITWGNPREAFKVLERLQVIFDWDNLSQNKNLYWTEDSIKEHKKIWTWHIQGENESLPWFQGGNTREAIDCQELIQIMS
jgi:hypothetical protein